MKRFLKIVGILLLLILVAGLVASFVLPKDPIAERSIVINAPRQAVFNQIVYFKNWPSWSPWYEMDTAAQLTYSGTDGQPGSSYSWNGKELGSGTMTNVEIKGGNEMVYDLAFVEPFESKSEGFLRAEDAGAGKTKVTWSMKMHMPWPMNVMQLMYDPGDDFEKGLKKMKDLVEKNPNAGVADASSAGTDITQMQFPATRYAVIRKTVGVADMEKFYGDAFSKLGQSLSDKIRGNGVGLVYKWNDKEMSGDIGAGFPVDNSVNKADGAIIENVPASGAYVATYTGGYSGIGNVHEALGKKVAADGKKQGMVIEEYVVTPDKEKDSTKWVTKVYYLTM